MDICLVSLLLTEERKAVVSEGLDSAELCPQTLWSTLRHFMVTENSGGLGMREGGQNDNAGSVWGPGLSLGRTPPLSCQREQAEHREPVQWSEDHSWTSFLPFYPWVFRLVASISS